MSFRAAVKHLLESTLVRSGAARVARVLNGGSTLVLAYHNVVPDDDAERDASSLHLAKSDFVAHLDFLQEATELLPLDDVGAVPSQRRRPRIALTFDDCYVGAVKLAGVELRRRGIPATYFACPGLVGGKPFWWDEYSAEGREALCFHELAGDGDRIREMFAGESVVARSVTQWRQPASLDDIRELMDRSPELQVGPHTWLHPNLARIGAERLRHELEAPLQWVHEHFPRPSAWLACPYGFTSDTVRAEAERIGYRGVLEIGGDWVSSRSWNPWQTPRASIPTGLSRLYFQLRVSGLMRHRESPPSGLGPAR